MTQNTEKSDEMLSAAVLDAAKTLVDAGYTGGQVVEAMGLLCIAVKEQATGPAATKAWLYRMAESIKLPDEVAH